jgi:hypothetical protein
MAKKGTNDYDGYGLLHNARLLRRSADSAPHGTPFYRCRLPGVAARSDREPDLRAQVLSWDQPDRPLLRQRYDDCGDGGGCSHRNRPGGFNPVFRARS